MTQVVFDERKVKREAEKGINRAQVALDIQIAKDSNFYCPVRDGHLRSSVMRSDFGSGILTWDAVYARSQYYGKPNKSKDTNPNARMAWFEEAKATKKKEWEKLANAKFDR